MVEYGGYGEDGFKNLVNQAKFCFLINGTESQGIAVQELCQWESRLLLGISKNG